MHVPQSVRVVEDRWSTARHVTEVVAIVAAGLWALYVFVYQERIKPSLEPPSVELTATFDRGSVVRGVRVAQLHIRVLNTGHVNSDIYGESVTVYGSRFARPARRVIDPTPADPGHAEDDRTVATTPPEAVYAYGRLRDAAIGGRSGWHIVLTPGEHFEFQVPIAVRDGRYDQLGAQVTAIFGRYREDRHHFAHVKLVHEKSGLIAVRLPPAASDDDGKDIDFNLQVTL